MKIKFLIVIAIFCSLLLFSKDIQTVYAEATITVITPTGGGLVSTADCTDITANAIGSRIAPSRTTTKILMICSPIANFMKPSFSRSIARNPNL